MSMTLEQVRDWLAGKERMFVGYQRWATSLNESQVRAFRNAIDAHLTQPAQPVDVDKVKEVIASHRHEITLCNKHDQESIDYLTEMTDKLTAALQEKGNG